MNDISLERRFKDAEVLPLWLHTGPAMVHEPRGVEKACHWKWKDLQELGQTVGDRVSGKDAERRVLVLANPGFGGRLATTGTLNAALQILNPGETADPHRHSMAAIRLITDQDGGVTTVNDTECPMAAGDLILTPAWCWHGHFNDTQKRAMWVDVLDVPLVASWDGVFFEYPEDKDHPEPSRWASVPAPHYAQLIYTWEETRKKLDGLPARGDGSRELRYTNPTTNGPILPTIDCYAAKLAGGKRTDAVRSTASTLVYVLDGNGVSKVGDQEISWAKNDVFTLPNWHWSNHLASSDDAYIIKISNSGMLEALGLLQTEMK